MAYQLPPMWETFLDEYSKEHPDPRKANCYNCKFRDQAVGSAHSECSAPDGKRVHIEFIMLGRPMIKNGNFNLPLIWNDPSMEHYFWWPVDFDPTWLKFCFLFKEKEANGERKEGMDSGSVGVDRA